MTPILETFDGPAGAACLYRRVTEPHFSTPLHFHPELEVLRVVEGYGTVYVGDGFQDFGPGDIGVIAGGVAHWWCSHRDFYGAAPPGRCVAEYVQLAAPRLLPPGLLAGEYRDLRALLRRARRGILIGPAAAHAPATRLRAVGAAAGLRRVAAAYELLAALAEVSAYELVSGRDPEAAEPDATTTGRLGAVYALVAERYPEPLRLADAAAAVGLAETSFSRWFRRRTRGTFSAFLTEYRLARACERLRTTDDPIAATAYATGFRNLSNFNRAFRRSRGVAPRDYRARYTA